MRSVSTTHPTDEATHHYHPYHCLGQVPHTWQWQLGTGRTIWLANTWDGTHTVRSQGSPSQDADLAIAHTGKIIDSLLCTATVTTEAPSENHSTPHTPFGKRCEARHAPDCSRFLCCHGNWQRSLLNHVDTDVNRGWITWLGRNNPHSHFFGVQNQITVLAHLGRLMQMYSSQSTIITENSQQIWSTMKGTGKHMCIHGRRPGPRVMKALQANPK